MSCRSSLIFAIAEPLLKQSCSRGPWAFALPISTKSDHHNSLLRFAARVFLRHCHNWRSFPPRNCPRKKDITRTKNVVKCHPSFTSNRRPTTMGTGRCTARNQGNVNFLTPPLQNPKGLLSTNTTTASSHRRYVNGGFMLCTA